MRIYGLEYVLIIMPTHTHTARSSRTPVPLGRVSGVVVGVGKTCRGRMRFPATDKIGEFISYQQLNAVYTLQLGVSECVLGPRLCICI